VAIAVSTKAGLSALTTNTGSHGFTGILFAYTSYFANNGKSFAGLSMNTPFYNLTTALAMMVGRFGLAIPALALAALLGRQRNTPKSSGTLPTDSFIFGLLLTACLVTLVALSYLPTEADKGNNGMTYQLPTGTYVVEGSNSSLQNALTVATQAAAETGRQSWVMVADWSAV
jgi:nitrate reductase gamma subunit